MRLELPFPPSVNNLYATNSNTLRRHKSKRGIAYQREVRARVLEQHGLVRSLSGPLRVTVEHIPPDARRRDHDNYSKALWDSLGAAGVFDDDSQIVEAHYYWLQPSKASGTTVIIEEL